VTDPNQQPPILEPQLARWEIPNAAPQVSGWILPSAVLVQAPAGYVYVGFWRRLWAYLVDGLILGIPFWLIAAPLAWNPFIRDFFRLALDPGAYVIDPTTGAYTATPQTVAAMTALINRVGPEFDLLALVFFGVQMLYFGLLWSRRGASLGQELFGIEVRRESDGSLISFKRGCLRVFGYFVSALVLYIGFIWATFDPRKQGWHDKIAATVVVRRSGPRTKPAPGWIVVLTVVSLIAAVVGGAWFVGYMAAQIPR